MLRYIEKVISPYVDSVREELDLPLRQKALCIFDVYKAHRGQELLDMMTKFGIKVVFVPGACTDRLQPLDLIPNNIFKTLLRSEFHAYYAREVKKQLSAGTAIADVDIDMRSSAIKPVHAQWLVNAIAGLSKKTDLIRESFVKAGL